MISFNQQSIGPLQYWIRHERFRLFEVEVVYQRVHWAINHTSYMNIQFSSCQLNSLSDWVCHLREIQIIMAFLFLFRKTFNSFSFELEHASPFGAYGHGTLLLEKSVLIVLNWKIQWPFGTVIFIIWRWKHGFCYIYIAVRLLLLISQHGMRMFTRADTQRALLH